MDLKTVCLPSSCSIHIDESSSQTSGSLLVQLMAVSVETDNGPKFREVSVALSLTWGICITPHPVPVRDRLWSRTGKTARARTTAKQCLPDMMRQLHPWSQSCCHCCTRPAQVRAVNTPPRVVPSSGREATDRWWLLRRERLHVHATWAALLAHKKGRKRREKDNSFWVMGSSSDQAVQAWASWGTVE